MKRFKINNNTNKNSHSEYVGKYITAYASFRLFSNEDQKRKQQQQLLQKLNPIITFKK